MLRKFATLLFLIFILPGFKQVTGNFMELNPEPVRPFSSSKITLFLSGDVMTGRGIDQVLPTSVDPRLYEDYVKDAGDYVRLAEKKNGPIKKPVPYDYIWGDALEIWREQKPDLKIINLETSITDHPEPWPGKAVQYRMHPENIKVLQAAGIDFCTLANNHTLDWNREGLLETLTTLRKAGIPYAGAGENQNEARKPAVLKTKAGRVIILAYGSETSGIPASWAAGPNLSGLNLLPDLHEKTVELIKAQVKAIKQPGDIVVFSVHWGGNWGYDIPPAQRTFAHRLIDEAGVDLIHGHSSHHPQGLEVYKEKLIVYGAGDFINDYEGINSFEKYRGDLSLMYFPEMDPASGKLLSLKMVPMQTRNLRLHKAKTTDAEWVAATMDRESRNFGARVRLEKDGSLSVSW